jgi:Ring finger domain
MQSSISDEELKKISDETCSVCLLTINYPACRLDCMHYFCSDCIQEWCKSHTSCPLCSKQISSGIEISPTGSYKPIAIQTKTQEKELSLDCLDHAYFKQEISKLLRLSYELEVSKFKKRNSNGTPTEWKALQQIKNRLEVLKQNNQNFIRYDPTELLNEVYELNSKIDMIKSGCLPTDLYIEDEKNFYEEEEDDDYNDYYDL